MYIAKDYFWYFNNKCLPFLMEYYPIYKEQSSKHERRTHLKANKHCILWVDRRLLMHTNKVFDSGIGTKHISNILLQRAECCSETRRDNDVTSHESQPPSSLAPLFGRRHRSKLIINYLVSFASLVAVPEREYKPMRKREDRKFSFYNRSFSYEEITNEFNTGFQLV